MTRTDARRALAVVLVAMAPVTTACRTAPSPSPAPTPSSPAPSTPASSSDARRAADDAAYQRTRADSARRPYTAADVHFMTMMIGHHAQAVEMSRLAPTRAASPAVQRLAERIISAQQDEITTMQQWLRDRRKPVPDPMGASSGGMAGHDHHAMTGGANAGATAGAGAHGGAHAGAHAAMPGMLTPAQMKELEQARGEAFDRLFLTYMIQHHRGATAMVQQLFGSYGAGQDETVFKFASDVNVDQETEIARMQRMLRALELEGVAR